MRRIMTTLAALVVIGIAFCAALILWPLSRSAPEEDLAQDWQPPQGAGEYAMRAGDCMACHTADGGADFAGGRPIETPLGVIYTRNITPDPATGIGNWSLDDFRAALIDGTRPNGQHLYPAMPYENYRMLLEQDIRALYAYFMTEVAPVRHEPRDPDLPFPFDQRWGLRALNWLLLRHDAGYLPDMGEARLDRGQYLVDAPGHCAACHSPRTLYMGQKGITRAHPDYLSGGHIAGWKAPALRGPQSTITDWSVQDLADFLSAGRNSHFTANGEMALVVEHSLQHLAAEDQIAMAGYLKALEGGPVIWPDAESSANVAQSLPIRPERPQGVETANLLRAADPDMPLGPRLYLDNCSACHFVTGQGSPEIFPALDGNSLVVSEEATPLLRIILEGAEVPGTERRPMPLIMQGYGERLDDNEIAVLASFLRQAWGNRASAVSGEDVRKIRAELAEKNAAGQ